MAKMTIQHTNYICTWVRLIDRFSVVGFNMLLGKRNKPKTQLITSLESASCIGSTYLIKSPILMLNDSYTA